MTLSNILTKSRIETLLKNGEGITIEYKKATNTLPSTLFESITAFLNRDGGEILLGVNDNKTITGVNEDAVNLLCKQISNKLI